MLKKTEVVLFDFDGTLSAYDANFEFAKYCFRRSLRPWLFSPLILLGAIARKFNPGGVWWRETMRRFVNEKMVKKAQANAKLLTREKNRRILLLYNNKER